MEKRTSPLTVMLEPSVHDALRMHWPNVSAAVHDMLVDYLIQNNLIQQSNYTVPTATGGAEVTTFAEPAAGTITKVCANCMNYNVPDLEWHGQRLAYYCKDEQACYMRMRIRGRK